MWQNLSFVSVPWTLVGVPVFQKKLIITLNKQLLEAPRNCIEYVVVHELCHLVHPNHSKQFYTFLTMFMPDWKERKAELEKNCILWL
ncbi:MAG: M48 family metallopeptidase [Subdoligranulum sp.]